MDPTRNPYNPGAGVPPPELAGRDAIIEQARIAIRRSRNGLAARSMMMLGLRGVGKTVLLNRIDQIAESEACHTAVFEADPDKTLPEQLTQQLHRLLLKLDRRRKAGEDIQAAFSLLRSFASAFKVKYGEFEFGLSAGGSTGDLALDLSDLFVAVGQAAAIRKHPAVILIDEVQYLTKSDLAALIVALHKVSQRQLPILFFGAGLPQLAKLAGEAKSYAERLFDYPPVGRLEHKEAARALTEPARRENVEYDPEALNHIIDETAGYPFFLQVWGSHAWEAASASPISVADARVATARAIQALDQGFYKVRYDRLTDRQLEYARAMAEYPPLEATSTAVARRIGLTASQAAPIRDEIIKKGLAYSPRRGVVAFTVPKFDEYLRRRIPEIRS